METPGFGPGQQYRLTCVTCFGYWKLGKWKVFGFGKYFVGPKAVFGFRYWKFSAKKPSRVFPSTTKYAAPKQQSYKFYAQSFHRSLTVLLHTFMLYLSDSQQFQRMEMKSWNLEFIFNQTRYQSIRHSSDMQNLNFKKINYPP